MQKIVHIVGPTGVGKTNLAVKVAKKFNGSLISADSVQVYKTLDIISGKDIPKGSKLIKVKKLSNNFDLGYYKFNGIKIYLLDVVKPSYSFSVYDFLRISNEVVELIVVENKLPIIVGGTGLYSQKFIEGLDNLGIKADLKLREKLQKLDLSKLQEMLKKLNVHKFENLNSSDVNNPRRLIRAIEIARFKNHESGSMNQEEKYQNLVIGLMCDRGVLRTRIEKRVKKRLQNGAMDEAKTLFKNYENLSPQVKNANGYKQAFSYLNNEVALNEAIDKWKLSEFRLAKNQMTWFRKYGKAKWFDVLEKGYEKDIYRKISLFLT